MLAMCNWHLGTDRRMTVKQSWRGGGRCPLTDQAGVVYSGFGGARRLTRRLVSLECWGLSPLHSSVAPWCSHPGVGNGNGMWCRHNHFDEKSVSHRVCFARLAKKFQSIESQRQSHRGDNRE